MLRMSLLRAPSARVSFYHNSTPFSKLFGEQARAPGWEARLGAGSPRERQLGARSCEDVSGETARTTSRAAARSPEFRGCLRRNGPDHLAHGISEPTFARMSQAKRSIPDNSETRSSRMSQAKRPRPPLARRPGAQNCEDVSGETPNPGQLRNESCEDVSGETARTTSRTASQSSEMRGCLRRNAQSRTTQKREL